MHIPVFGRPFDIVDCTGAHSFDRFAVGIVAGRTAGIGCIDPAGTKILIVWYFY